MIASVIIPGFLLGAAGSLHCVGMCGPLSLALPTSSMTRTRQLFSLFLYQLGRITTYTMLGLIVGVMGSGIHLAGLQQPLSILSGIVILMLLYFQLYRGRQVRFRLLNGFNQFIREKTAQLLRRIETPAGFYAFGLLNGLLPCGMIYVALAAAVALPFIPSSMLFMAMFGAGTLPAMMTVALVRHWAFGPRRQWLRKLGPVLAAFAAILLILRGLTTDHAAATTGKLTAIHCVVG